MEMRPEGEFGPGCHGLECQAKTSVFYPVDNREWAEADDQIRMMTYGKAGGYFGNGGRVSLESGKTGFVTRQGE